MSVSYHPENVSEIECEELNVSNENSYWISIIIGKPMENIGQFKVQELEQIRINIIRFNLGEEYNSIDYKIFNYKHKLIKIINYCIDNKVNFNWN